MAYSGESVKRRTFLFSTVAAVLGATSSLSGASYVKNRRLVSGSVTLLLTGDVMTGRGIDQVLPHPGDPRLYEPYVKTAIAYVELAESANGPIPRPVDFAYVWGDALAELQRVRPDVRLINLETSITKSDDPWRGKGINYRMHPDNLPCLTAAGIDCCALANNHVLDWGYAGLLETLATLRSADIKTVGAGRDRHEAEAPAIIARGEARRVVVFAFGFLTSGIPQEWAAGNRAGVYLLPDLSKTTVSRVAAHVSAIKRSGDIVVASIHWGSNWGYEIPQQQRAFAHGLIDEALVDVIHGHSSHHAKGIEVYNDRPIIYGCGDFVNDYEGISGYEAYRDDLVLMYFVTLNAATGELERLEMTPLQIRRFRLHRASEADTLWLRDVLTREGKTLGTVVRLGASNTLLLEGQHG